jgi:4-phospho-D-threonate 3-dehydrogenase / 4-phospho-D-erythronate 3-dehydrogenase
MRKPRVLVTSGDPGGVGPELILRALADPEVGGLADFTVVGSPASFRRDAEALGLPMPGILPAGDSPGVPAGGPPGVPASGPAKAPASGPPGVPASGPPGVPASDPVRAPADRPPVPVGRPSAEGARAAVKAVAAAVALMAWGEAGALVTAPVSKEALRLGGYPWPGQTEMLADLCATGDLRVLLMAGPLRVVHVTAHRSLRDAIDGVTRASVLRTIGLADDIGWRLLGRPPRVAVAGLNPHAGEHGILGDEDEEAIRPAVAKARSLGIDASGPLSADTLFPRAAAGDTDLVVAMYHDQGHIPVKLLGPHEGVAVTLGLPFLRMSPDHGAAFDIAGKGVARAGSMKAAMRAAAEAAGRDIPATRGTP